MALYYEYKALYDKEKNKSYNYDKYYQDKQFKSSMINDAANLFLAHTVKILVKTANDNNKSANVNNWVRSASCEPAFLQALREDMASDFEIETKFKEFTDKYRA